MPNVTTESRISFEAKNTRFAIDTEYVYKLLPEVYREADSEQGYPLRRILREVVGTRLNTIVANIQDFPLLVDYEYCPAYALDHLLYNIGNPFPTVQLSEIDKRKLIALLISIYKSKGTYNGILLAVQAVTGLSITITVPWLTDTWSLGYVSELGVTTHVNALRNDRYNYTFIVQLPSLITLDLERLVKLVIDYMKPLYTHYIISPPSGAPPVVDHWELDISELGYNTFLHTSVPSLIVQKSSGLEFESHGTAQSTRVLDYEYVATSVLQSSLLEYEAGSTVTDDSLFNYESEGSSPFPPAPPMGGAPMGGAPLGG